MKDKLKIILNKYIYEKLELGNVEQEIIGSGVTAKEVVNDENLDLASSYFFLMNDIYLERLDEVEMKSLESYINNIDFHNIILSNDLIKFIEENISKLLLPNTNESYISYCGAGLDYIAPSDSIVLAFHYIKNLNNSEENIDRQEELIYEKMNYIQSVLSPSKQMKVAVLIFDEIVKGNFKNL